MNHNYEKTLRNPIHDKTVTIRDQHRREQEYRRTQNVIIKYEKGESVNHPKFGEGIIEKIEQRESKIRRFLIVAMIFYFEKIKNIKRYPHIISKLWISFYIFYKLLNKIYFLFFCCSLFKLSLATVINNFNLFVWFASLAPGS